MRTWRVALWRAGARRGFLPPGLGTSLALIDSIGLSAARHRQTVSSEADQLVPCRRNWRTAKISRSGNFFSGLPFAPVIPPRAKSHPSSEGVLPTGDNNRVRNAFVGGRSGRAMPDTGSPPGPPEPAGTQPWPGFDKFSAVQVGRPSTRGDPDVLATVHRPQTAPYTPWRENRRAREAPERRARPPRAPSTRRFAREKSAPFVRFFAALFIPRGQLGLMLALTSPASSACVRRVYWTETTR